MLLDANERGLPMALHAEGFVDDEDPTEEVERQYAAAFGFRDPALPIWKPYLPPPKKEAKS